jgi:hypothetical protein
MNEGPAEAAPQPHGGAEPCHRSMASAVALLADLARLEPGWDGHGADPITPSCLTNVSTVLAALPAGTPRPEIVPNPNGTLTLDWEAGGYGVSLECGATRYSAVWESAVGMETDEGHIRAGIPAFVTDALESLFQNLPPP